MSTEDCTICPGVACTSKKPTILSRLSLLLFSCQPPPQYVSQSNLQKIEILKKRFISQCAYVVGQPSYRWGTDDSDGGFGDRTGWHHAKSGHKITSPVKGIAFNPFNPFNRSIKLWKRRRFSYVVPAMARCWNDQDTAPLQAYTFRHVLFRPSDFSKAVGLRYVTSSPHPSSWGWASGPVTYKRY